MATLLNNAGLYVGEYNLSAVLNEILLETDTDVHDVTSFGTAAFRECLLGLKGARFSASGFYDPANADAPLNDKWGDADQVVTIAAENAAAGMAYLLRGCIPTYRSGGNVGEPGVVNLTGQTTQAPIVQGRVLHRATAANATGTGTGQQIGAVGSTKSIYATMHVFGIAGTGTPTITVKIQSDDNSGFTSATDRLTFAAATAVGAQWVSSGPGAITDDWWRVQFTITGSSPVFGFLVGFGIF